MSEIDQAFSRTRSGDHAGFADWVRLVELPLRASLRRFARVVDVEAVVQETLLRIWRLAPTLEFDGEDASLRFAITVARNLAREEVRRAGRFEPFGDGEPVIPVDPDPRRDPGLRAAIRRCLDRLTGRPRQALVARLDGRSILPDRELAERLHMTLNTFLQNVTRARRTLAQCLAKHGVPLGGLAP